MKEMNVDKVKKILNLKREIIGVKFVYYQEDYQDADVKEYGLKTTYCNMLKRAMDGEYFKVTRDNFFCDYGAYATGVEKADISIVRGSSYGCCGLYESNAIARSITEEMCYHQYETYGLIIGPLQEMKEADLVIIVSDAANIMRIVQGYAYKFGMPKNFRTIGNQAACSDLTAKPFYKNDLNLSLMCEGARKYMRCDRGELGVGMPISQFDSIAEGIIMTVNPVLNNREKDELLLRLECEDELGIKIDKNEDYGKRLEEYDERVKLLKGQDYGK